MEVGSHNPEPKTLFHEGVAKLIRLTVLNKIPPDWPRPIGIGVYRTCSLAELTRRIFVHKALYCAPYLRKPSFRGWGLGLGFGALQESQSRVGGLGLDWL